MVSGYGFGLMVALEQRGIMSMDYIKAYFTIDGMKGLLKIFQEVFQTKEFPLITYKKERRFFVNTKNIVNYKNGYIHGPYKYFYDNGNIQTSGMFKMGFKIGRWILFEKNGDLIYIGNFTDDHRGRPNQFMHRMEGEYITYE